ncbi:O-succinylhomoserine sulfhydrylase [Caulobacter segnis]|uniref:O-succinylhomoserine sulfhydrylase n=1 Tax=Caulobacter segnis TaxID=88688 RepID=UPI0024100F5D|nr:O-succinylhomoserine sulfhydrylase [Caulobacter segnis]MDG2523206.1 O-succinylhomoserine sulfhydrylase [Caulobacter segnis]
MAENPKSWNAATKLIRGGLMRSPWGETAEGLFLTQSFVYDSAQGADARFAGDEPGFVYSRYANPTTAMFEQRLALLEGAEACRAVASGMAAVHVALSGLVQAGDHIVAGRALFGSCRWILSTLMPRYGVEVTYVDGPDLKAWEAAMRPNTKAVLIETPCNPLLEITDIEEVSKLAHAAGAKVVVDNVFATPIFQKPLELGADVVVYSTTKHIDGQGRVLGGAILCSQELMDEAYRDLLRHTGPSISPFNAWLHLNGLATLDLRVRAQTATAGKLADIIGNHEKAQRIFYPGRSDHPQADVARKQMSGFSNLVAFDLGSRERAWAFLDALQLVDISNNLGDAKSMATHPSTTTHRSMSDEDRIAIGVTEGCVRMSVGLEDADDLARDVERALDAA